MNRELLPQPVIESLAAGNPPFEHDHEEVIVSMAQEISAARQRIAEMELDNGALTALQADLGKQLETERKVHDYNRSLLAQSNADHNALVVEKARLTAILRAVYPVYRAAETWDRALGWNGDPAVSLSRSCHTARAALTPDLVAALRAAGVEVEGG